MYRSLIQTARLALNQNNLGIPKTYSTSSKNIQISSFILKQNHRSLTDDMCDIPPYNEIGRMRNLSVERFIEYLKEQLICPSNRAMEIFSTYPEFKDRSMYDVKKNVDLLIRNGVTHAIILDNPWMLTLNHDRLKKSLQVLEGMKPKDINDFAPLTLISPEVLIKIKTITEKDKIPWQHRIYYISELLDIQPHTISKHASKWLFTLQVPFEIVDSRLKALLKCLPSKAVANNLWLLGLSTTKIEYCKAQATKAGFSLTPNIFKKSKKDFLASIREFNDQKALLGGRSLKQYFADRLKLDLQTIDVMLAYEPRIKHSNVISMEKKLDYLLNEASVSALCIAQHPQILVKSLDEIKHRFKELQSYGVQSNFLLRASYRPAKDYNNYVIELKSLQKENSANKE